MGSLFLLSCEAQDLKACKFDAIYQLGDSISDTGNSIVEIPPAFHSRLPYGETIGKATGRPSDGYLMIDFIAQSAGLPFLEPYENPNSKFTHGADFSVAGARAMSAEDLLKLNLDVGFTNSSLSVQLGWLKKVLSTVCNGPKDCQEKLKSSLFMVGLIGPNDLMAGLFKGDGIEKVKTTVLPAVLQTVIDGVQTVISYGASRVVVPGAYPLGCTPSLLTTYSVNKSAAYDSLGCLKDYNDFFAYYNTQLQIALENSRKANPNVIIIYSDFYSATQSILDNLSTLGFKAFRKACCGIGGEFNFTPTMQKTCGAKGVPVCPNPKEHVFWDGGHFSHHANMVLAEWLIKEMLPQLHCSA